ncbi:MAG: hypothetical protein ACIAXF_12445 [Phycisphaerales bacterium JB063]
MIDQAPLQQTLTEGYETWRFTAMPGEAQRVYLVLDGGVGPSRWVEMQPVVAKPGHWDATVQLKPGHHRARFFTGNNGAFLNCGDFGLTAQRMGEPCPGVHLAPLEALAA